MVCRMCVWAGLPLAEAQRVRLAHEILEIGRDVHACQKWKRPRHVAVWAQRLPAGIIIASLFRHRDTRCCEQSCTPRRFALRLCASAASSSLGGQSFTAQMLVHAGTPVLLSSAAPPHHAFSTTRVPRHGIRGQLEASRKRIFAATHAEAASSWGCKAWSPQSSVAQGTTVAAGGVVAQVAPPGLSGLWSKGRALAARLGERDAAAAPKKKTSHGFLPMPGLRSMLALSLVLRATGPLSSCMLAANLLGVVAIPSLLRAMLLAEAIFYWWSCAMARLLSAPPKAPPLTVHRRRKLWGRLLADPGNNSGSAQEFAAAWFDRADGFDRRSPIPLAAALLPAPLRQLPLLRRVFRPPPVLSPVRYDELTTSDVESWLAGGLLGKPLEALDPNERDELSTLISDLEVAARQPLKPPAPPPSSALRSRTGGWPRPWRRPAASGEVVVAQGSPAPPALITPMRPQIDPLRWTARPLLYYSISHAFSAFQYTPNSMRKGGFGTRRTVEIVPPRSSTDANGRDNGRVAPRKLHYFHRPASAGSEHLPPVIFVHGVGFGPAPYANFLAALGDASGAEVLAIEMPSFAQRISLRAAPPPRPEEFGRFVDALLAQHGHSSAHLVGHSMGTAFVTYAAKHASHAILSTSYLDPVCLGMHVAQVSSAGVRVRSNVPAMSHPPNPAQTDQRVPRSLSLPRPHPRPPAAANNDRCCRPMCVLLLLYLLHLAGRACLPVRPPRYPR